MMEKIRHYIYRAKGATEQVLLEDREKSLDKGKLVHELLRGETKQERFVSLLRLIKGVLPENLINIDKEKLGKLLRCEKEPPFNPQEYKLRERIGGGGECQVYLLQGQTEENSSWALKITMPDKNKPKSISERLKFIKNQRQKVLDLYQDIPDLIPPEYSLVLSDPNRCELPAIATLQPFVSGEIEDIFRRSPEELVNLTNQDNLFREQLKNFCQKTIDDFKKTGEVLDMLGEENVSVIENKNKEKRLIILDSHLVYNFSEQPIRDLLNNSK
ncbi:MAG: hypothetical protein NT058_00165 [Candidatus Portnoybacteria bacterium]|nr:hypothetical protein [Candidatus Portnoybacteria bacterium]